jgi:hypothetical protein
LREYLTREGEEAEEVHQLGHELLLSHIDAAKEAQLNRGPHGCSAGKAVHHRRAEGAGVHTHAQGHTQVASHLARGDHWHAQRLQQCRRHVEGEELALAEVEVLP